VIEDGPRGDLELMMRFASGDDEAFDALVGRHKNSAYRLAYRYLHHDADAEEVALEAFVRVWRSRTTYVPTASFTTWLYRIIVNLCYNKLRSHRTLESRHRASSEEAELGLQTQKDEQTSSPADDLAGKELEQMLQQAIRDLPAAQRMAVLLSRFEGLSYADTASAMGTTEKAVKSLMARARAALAQKLKRYTQE